MTAPTTPILSLSANSSSATAAACLLAIAGATLASCLHVTLRRRRGRSSLRAVKPAKEKAVHVRSGGAEAASNYEQHEVARAKADMMRALRNGRCADGSPLPVDHPSVASPLSCLRKAYSSSGVDARTSADPCCYDGDYLMEHSPSFLGRLGHNADGDPMFTMGRMTFSMIRPTDLVCSIQRVTQHARRLPPSTPLPEKIPVKLRDEVEARVSELRTMDTYMYFTVEEDPRAMHPPLRSPPSSKSSPSSSSSPTRCPRGPRGVMRMDGYSFPHPTEPNRMAVWFTAGVCIPQEGEDLALWNRTFGCALPRRPLSEQATLFIARMILGAVPSNGLSECDGRLSFELGKPIPAYHDVAYVDEDIRVTVGNKGTVVVVSRLRRDMKRRCSMLYY